ncbi:MAG: TetR/AcrR family transcriptional regulator [Oricola sp.]|jgi:TetR/AcrR family transcriptional regulator, mexJK operon transcriptional repressor|nr:TetR/AcrR family transcriptional regulator [Oricola sp.]
MTATSKRGRRPDPAKDAAILDAASALFLDRGYSVSIDDIAAAAGVSKQTVYARFASKEELFEAVVRSGADQLVGALFDAQRGLSLDAALTELGARYQEIVLDPRRVSMQRVMIAQAQQFPDLAQRFFDSGPGYVQRRLAEYLKSETEKGRLNVSDASEAAEQFLGLVKGADQLAALLAVGDAPNADNRAKRVAGAVSAFLKIYRK